MSATKRRPTKAEGGTQAQANAADRARQRAENFAELLNHLAAGDPEFFGATGAGAILADLADAVKRGEWDAAVARLLGWALHRAARAEGREDPAFRIATARLTALVSGGFVPPGSRPSSKSDARYDAMILAVENARTMPEAVAALNGWYQAAGFGPFPAVEDPKLYDRLRRRAARAAEAAGLDLEDGDKFGAERGGHPTTEEG